MASSKKSRNSPEEKLKRKIRKKVKNQSGFFKHAITYFVFFTFGLAAAFIIRDEGFVIPFVFMFSIWMFSLIIHGLSAFVFNRIDSWGEAEYLKKLKEFNLRDETYELPHKMPETEDEEDEYMDLSSYEKLRKKMDDRWNEGDLV